MKQVLLSLPVDITTVSQAAHAIRCTDEIVAYETRGGKGLGILIQKRNGNGNSWGFAYHTDLVRNSEHTRYEGNTPIQCIEKVLKDDRKVLIFDSFQEFLVHANKMNKY